MTPLAQRPKISATGDPELDQKYHNKMYLQVRVGKCKDLWPNSTHVGLGLKLGTYPISDLAQIMNNIGTKCWG